MVPRISLIVPTRRRPEQFNRLLASLVATADRADLLEVVAVIDADDLDARIECADLHVQRVIVPAGQTMGALNSAGFAASSGEFVMLLNDDVVARTPGWDTMVRTCFAAFPDGILLVHVNDTVFREVLCTFPMLSRAFCQQVGGICPETYRRYRIDDHIEDIFNLLGVLGERRSLYLPEVVFEHLNHVTNEQGVRQYFSEPSILARDAALFDQQFAARKETALRLKFHLHPRATDRRRAWWRQKLERVPESFVLRRPERLRVVTAVELSRPGGLSRREPWLHDWRRRLTKCIEQKGYRGLVAAAGRRLRRAAGGTP